MRHFGGSQGPFIIYNWRGSSGLDHLHQPRHFVHVDIINALGIGRATAPLHPAIETREHDGFVAAGAYAAKTDDPALAIKVINLLNIKYFRYT